MTPRQFTSDKTQMLGYRVADSPVQQQQSLQSRPRGQVSKNVLQLLQTQ